MLYNFHQTNKGVLLTLCDKELLGLTLKSHIGEFNINSSLYSGERMNFQNEKKMNELIKKADLINSIGKKSFEALKKQGLTSSKYTLFIGDHPKCQIFLPKDE